MEFKHYWICTDCAHEKGAKSIPATMSTMTEGKCEYCNRDKSVLIPIRDFLWPKRRKTK